MADIQRPESRPELVERVFGHRFRDLDLLLQACTHASRIGASADPAERRRRANERMEFLGDALLGAAVALALYRRHPEADEGQLTRIKGSVVSRHALARVAERCGLLEHCVVGAQLGSSWPDSVKANLMEGVLGAIHLDGGWEALVRAVDQALAGCIDDPSLAEADPRMALQAWSLEHHQKLPVYQTERSGGTDHAPEFTSKVGVADASASATGPSRKRAEAGAAETLLRQLRSVQTG